jgi:hypothetical protein
VSTSAVSVSCRYLSRFQALTAAVDWQLENSFISFQWNWSKVAA